MLRLKLIHVSKRCPRGEGLQMIFWARRGSGGICEAYVHYQGNWEQFLWGIYIKLDSGCPYIWHQAIAQTSAYWLAI